jgi:thiopurine S-methyltransferase
MEANFWRERWANGEIAFHLSEANPLLVEHMDKLALPSGSRVFVPLCGKTRDIAWLLSQGYRVCGAELVETAVQQLFHELGMAPVITAEGAGRRYGVAGVDIFVGDLFALSAEALGVVDAVYDRAALVALPPALRERYAAHLDTLTSAAPQLLLTFVYDQSQMSGPPFSVGRDEVRRHYSNRHDVTLSASHEVVGGLRGQCPASEDVWLLR